MHQFAIASILLVGINLLTSQANVFYRPMRPEDLIRPVADPMYRLKECRVIFFHEAALKRDFPFLRGHSRQDVVKWIEENFCFMSASQMLLEGLRCSGTSDHCDSGEEKTGYRQPTWGRAATVPVTDMNGDIPPEGGMIDLKGIGHASSQIELHKTDGISIEEQHRRYEEAQKIPDEEERNREIKKLQSDIHSDGLLDMYNGILEIYRNAALQQLFNERNAKWHTRPENALQTIEQYFLLAHGVRSTTWPNQISVILGRQAHVGRSFSLGGTIGIYEDYYGRRQADIFSAAVDMGAVEIQDKRLQFSSELSKKAMQSFNAGNDEAIYDGYRSYLEPMMNPSYRCVKDEFNLSIDMRKPYTLKYALRTVFGRGKHSDPRESSRTRYNKLQSPKETYNSETFRLFKDAAVKLYQIKYPDEEAEPKLYNYREQWWETQRYNARETWRRMLTAMRLRKERELESWE